MNLFFSNTYGMTYLHMTSSKNNSVCSNMEYALCNIVKGVHTSHMILLWYDLFSGQQRGVGVELFIHKASGGLKDQRKNTCETWQKRISGIISTGAIHVVDCALLYSTGKMCIDSLNLNLDTWSLMLSRMKNRVSRLKFWVSRHWKNFLREQFISWIHNNSNNSL